jgi:hypothetical protein
MELREDSLSVSRELSALDRSVIDFTSVLDSVGVDYVVVSGYVAILTGRSRATEDVDVVLEPLSESATDELVATLEDRGYWGMAMPLSEMFSMLEGGDRIRIAEEDTFYPNFEVWFASNEIEREALSASIAAEMNDHRVAISPIELQIAYKLGLAQRSGSTTGKDFEDALHLFLTFEGQFNEAALEDYVKELGVEEYYAELRNA